MDLITNYKSTCSYNSLTYYYFWSMNREKYLPKHKRYFTHHIEPELIAYVFKPCRMNMWVHY